MCLLCWDFSVLQLKRLHPLLESRAVAWTVMNQIIRSKYTVVIWCKCVSTPVLLLWLWQLFRSETWVISLSGLTVWSITQPFFTPAEELAVPLCLHSSGVIENKSAVWPAIHISLWGWMNPRHLEAFKTDRKLNFTQCDLVGAPWL